VQVHDIFTGIDNDVVPPHGEALIACRSKDGGSFGIRTDVSNRLDQRHVVDTLDKFGLSYDKITIYQQVASSVKDVCSSWTSHEIAIELFDKLDDKIADNIRERQVSILSSSVEIVQVKIVDLQIPEDLSRWFARQASERARLRALVEERKADEEKINNERQLYEAQITAEEARTMSVARKRVIEAEGHHNATRLEADALHYQKLQEALADAQWLSPARIRFTETAADPVSMLIKKVRVAFMGGDSQ
jgi:regulator of protease activity HflC (stomatin/prohibitin superfamily)